MTNCESLKRFPVGFLFTSPAIREIASKHRVMKHWRVGASRGRCGGICPRCGGSGECNRRVGGDCPLTFIPALNLRQSLNQKWIQRLWPQRQASNQTWIRLHFVQVSLPSPFHLQRRRHQRHRRSPTGPRRV